VLAADFSPRYERHGDDLVSIDISGVGRLFGTPRNLGEELRRNAAARGLRVHVAIARTRTAAIVLALARTGLTVVEPGEEAAALAPIPVGVLEKLGASACGLASSLEPLRGADAPSDSGGGGAPPQLEKRAAPRGAKNVGASFELPVLAILKTWGLKTLGELAALPSADLAARLGSEGLAWQAIARGDDVRPLVPTIPEERFETSIDLEWPIEGLEPLSFVLTRLLEPLSTRLERRDRAAAVLHVRLRLVAAALPTDGVPRRSPFYARTLELPAPIRDVRTLRTLALLDLESHPPDAPIDRVAVAIDPAPGRIVQHALFTRAHPTPEQLSTLVARLTAVMGQDRIGAPAAVDSDRPGAFEMRPFATNHDQRGARGGSRDRRDISARSAVSASSVISTLRRCREPVPARVAVADDRPVRVTTDRRAFAGGAVVQAAGPWRTSGAWWSASWNRDEWDVALSDGAVYRIFRDRDTDGWFIDGIVD
jgi:protein ImuB